MNLNKFFPEFTYNSKPLFVAFTFIYASLLIVFASSKHFLLGNDIADLAFFEQFAWLIAHGKLFEPSSLLNRAALQDHFSLLLIPIGIIYKFIPSTYTLLTMQSISLATLPVLAANFSRMRNSPNQLTLSLIIAIALSPYVFLVNLSNFHPEVVAAPFMLVALAESNIKRRSIFYLFFFLSLIAKKTQALFGLGICIYCFAKGNYRRSLITGSISILWWQISTNYSSVSGDFVIARLGYLGNNMIEILQTLFTRPWVVFVEAPPESILLYTLGLTLPFLALMNRKSLPALFGTIPVYFTNLISSAGMQRELDTHYSIAILPFLIIACLDSSYTLGVHGRAVLNRIKFLTMLLTIIAFLGYSRIAYFRSRYIPRFNEAVALHQIKSSISLDSSVLTNDNYISQFANRLVIMPIERNLLDVSTYDHIILPQNTNKARIGGKLKPIKGTQLDQQITNVLGQAKAKGFRCSESNHYVIHCINE